MVFSHFRSLKNFWAGLLGQRISFFMWQANMKPIFREIRKSNRQLITKQRITFTISRNGDFLVYGEPFRVTLPKILIPAPNRVKFSDSAIKPKKVKLKVKFPTVQLNLKNATYAKLISRSKSTRPPARRTNKFHYNGGNWR